MQGGGVPATCEAIYYTRYLSRLDYTCRLYTAVGYVYDTCSVDVKPDVNPALTLGVLSCCRVVAEV